MLMQTHGRRANTIAPTPCIVMRSRQTQSMSAEMTLCFSKSVAATRFHTEHLAPGRVVVETSKPQPLSSWFTPVRMGRDM